MGFITSLKRRFRNGIEPVAFIMFKIFGRSNAPDVGPTFSVAAPGTHLRDNLDILADLAGDCDIDYDVPRLVHIVDAMLAAAGDLDAVVEYNEESKLKYEPRFRKNTLVTLVQECKNKFPMFKRSEANRMVARRFLYERMVEIGMRPSHIRNSLDVCVALVFSRDQADNDVDELLASQPYRQINAVSRQFEYTGWRFRELRPQGFSDA